MPDNRPGEFELIRRHFSGLTGIDAAVRLGIGDDCALLQPPAGQELAITTDTLVCGRHFPEGTSPFDIGWKALAVNLSDLAAMGATPRWFTLALTLPEDDGSWLGPFAEGLGTLAHEQRVALIGGDTTRGPLSITITAIGVVAAGLALRRTGAKPGDLVCVTGTLGDAALGLRLLYELDHEYEVRAGERGPGDRPRVVAYPLLGPNLSMEAVLPPIPMAQVRRVKRNLSEDTNPHHRYLWQRLNRPEPRVREGQVLLGLAHAAIDLSDGLGGDLAHLLEASGVGARVRPDLLPRSPAFEQLAAGDARIALQTAGGDDYELCICIPRERLPIVRDKLKVPLTEVGVVDREPGLRFVDAIGQTLDFRPRGYQHF